MACSGPPVGRDRQRGAATLLVAMVLLIAATLMILYTSQTTIMEQKMSANEMRQKQALAAAQAGIDAAIAGANASGGNLAQTPNTGGLGANPKGSYRSVFCKGTLGNAGLPTCAATPTALACTTPDATEAQSWLVSCGWSDDNTGVQRIVTYVGKMAPAPNPPSNPLIAKGGVNVGGNATVVNYYNNLTTWTGDALTASSATGKTMVRNPSQALVDYSNPANLAAAVQGNSGCGTGNPFVCTTTSGLAGPDVIASDTTLSNLTDTQFFQNIFGVSPDVYRNGMADKILTDAQANTNGAFSVPQIYWVDVAAGNTFNLGQDIGTSSAPVIVIVNGDMQFNASNDFFGMLYVTGNVTGGGSPNIFGSMVVEGSVNTNGAPNIIYYPASLDGLNNLSKFASMPGTWRDF
jgi:Tfp pilus assembly protein PilX